MLIEYLWSFEIGYMIEKDIFEKESYCFCNLLLFSLNGRDVAKC